MQEAVFFLLKIEASGNFVAELLNNSIWISFMIIEENWKKKWKTKKKKEASNNRSDWREKTYVATLERRIVIFAGRCCGPHIKRAHIKAESTDACETKEHVHIS